MREGIISTSQTSSEILFGIIWTSSRLGPSWVKWSLPRVWPLWCVTVFDAHIMSHSSSISWERSLLDQLTAAHWTLGQSLRSGQIAHSDWLPESRVFLCPPVLLRSCQPGGSKAILFSPEVLQGVLPWGRPVSSPGVEEIFEKLVARPEITKNYRNVTGGLDSYQDIAVEGIW